MIINSWFCAAPRDCLRLLFSRAWFCLCRSVDGEGWISQMMERKNAYCVYTVRSRHHKEDTFHPLHPRPHLMNTSGHKWIRLYIRTKRQRCLLIAQLTNPGKVLILSVQVCLPHKISISPYSPTHKLYLLTYTLPSFLRLRFTVVKF